ncbi:hypothetical protein [Bradyrhizobium sp. JR3.5]
MSALNGTAGRIGIIVGKTSGAQNTVCFEKDWSGLAAKTQQPFLAEFGAHSGGRGDAATVALII